MATKKITLNELRSLVKNIIKEETSKKKVIKENWEGVDSDLETSLFEYGFVVKQTQDKDYNDEWFVLYNADNNKFDTGYIRESELNNIILGKEWADEDDIQSFLNFVGSTKKDWLNSTFTNKLSDFLSYWGHQNIMGISYMGFSKDEAEEMLMNESVKPKTQKIKLSEVRQLVRSVIKEETSKNKVIKEDVFFDYILQGEDATEENAYDAARGLDWQEIETKEGNYPYLQHVDTVNGVGIHYNYGSDNYYFTDETMNESQLNEISSDTFKSAVDKSNKAGSDKRTDRLSKLYFDEFIGYKVLDGRIKEITAFTNDIGILVNMDNEKDKTLYYDYTKDHFSGDDRPMDRKSAVVFSKIFKKINPDTKYKSVGSAFKLSDNFNESKRIKLSEIRQLVRSIIKEDNK